ncbi:MAG TPA: outer membrane beta-barrel protein [Xanthobacteraceae bacterium]|nr:outer membrane beta-barrel protein [Xanthobacteraceae bacterium]
MRRIASLMAATAAVGIASAASAADLGLPVKAGPPVAAYPWGGCYIGAQLGGGVMSDTWASDYDGHDYRGAGWIAGGQVGCNYQTNWHVWGGAFVVGIEGEGMWSSLQNTACYNSGPLSCDTEGVKYTTRNNWDFDIAARFGLGFEQTLIYSKIGAVWGGFKFSQTQPSDDFYVATGSATLPGFLLGLGVEYIFLPNWTVKLEYDYMQFVTQTVHFNASFAGVPDVFDNFTSPESATKQIIKLGVNYKFDWANWGKAPPVLMTKD